MKYLGVWLGPNPNFTEHCRAASESSRKVESTIARILPNRGGAGEGRRKLLAAVAKAKLTYAAPAWVRAMNFKRNAELARGALRTGALRTIRGYRTTSTDAAEVLAASTPGDLLVRERAEAYWGLKNGNSTAKEEARNAALDRWQKRWDRKVNWTRTLIPNIRLWIERPHGELTFEMTQLLTGHGSFEDYRRKIGKVTSGNCIYCLQEPDTARHTLFHCPRWESERKEIETEIGEFSSHNAIQKMVQDEKAWSAVERFAKTVMTSKFKQEIERDRNPN